MQEARSVGGEVANRTAYIDLTLCLAVIGLETVGMGCGAQVDIPGSQRLTDTQSCSLANIMRQTILNHKQGNPNSIISVS